MREFPKRLDVKSKDEFPKIHMTRTLCYLRKELFEHITTKDENDYFDLGSFTKKYFTNNRLSISLSLFTQMKEELSELGWKCKTSYGGTGMFIYSSEDPPSLCYEDGL
jgi:hypothetical protein